MMINILCNSFCLGWFGPFSGFSGFSVGHLLFKLEKFLHPFPLGTSLFYLYGSPSLQLLYPLAYSL